MISFKNMILYYLKFYDLPVLSTLHENSIKPFIFY